MKFTVSSESSFASPIKERVFAFDGIVVNTTTLKALLEAANGLVALMYESDTDEIVVLHPYDC